MMDRNLALHGGKTVVDLVKLVNQTKDVEMALRLKLFMSFKLYLQSLMVYCLHMVNALISVFIYLGFFTSLSTLYRSYHDG